MSLTFWVGRNRFAIGSVPFLRAFFSTVFVRLENGSWGARYPVIMRDLYAGRLSFQKAEAALEELARIRTALARFCPDQVVWDFEDPAAVPPWRDDISSDITSLAGYFVTSSGDDFLEVLACALREAQHSHQDVEIR